MKWVGTTENYAAETREEEPELFLDLRVLKKNNPGQCVQWDGRGPTFTCPYVVRECSRRRKKKGFPARSLEEKH